MNKLLKSNIKMQKLLESYEETKKDLSIPRYLVDCGCFCFTSLEYIAAGRIVAEQNSKISKLKILASTLQLHDYLQKEREKKEYADIVKNIKK